MVTIDGVDQTNKMLDRISAGLSDVTPVLKQAGAVVIESSQQNFIQGGRPKWAPLSPVTLMLRSRGKGKKKKNVSGSNPLRNTGALMASVGEVSKDGIYLLEKGAITIGTNRQGAAAMQKGVKNTGGMVPGKTIPAREFLVVRARDEKRIALLVVEFVQKRIKEAVA